jgi:hypothetical protein
MSVSTPAVPIQSTPIDPAPARALHADLLGRFNSLTSGKSGIKTRPGSSETGAHQQEEPDDDEKTVEELLADLGPAEQVIAQPRSS